MRNLLLGAKHFALQSHSSKITTKHLIASLACLQAVDRKGYDQLLNILKTSETSSKKTIFTLEMLATIAEMPRIPYCAEVNGIIQLLKLSNYDLTSQITEPFVDAIAIKGAYHQVMSEVTEVRALLESKVFGQSQVIEVVSDAVMQMAWADKANRPRAIFFFLGPPATGKTYLSELLGKGLQGYSFKSFDMTQYVSEQEGFALTGLRKGFGEAAPGQLTGFIKKHPKSIIVFDEIEKSHTRVQTALLRMLSSGWVQDEYDMQDIDCREAIIIFTSNLGSELYSNRVFLNQVAKNPHQARDSILEVIRSEKKVENGHSVLSIPPEMISRLAQGGVVLFNKLDLAGLSRIASEQFELECKAFEQRLGIQVHVECIDALIKVLVLNFAPQFDVRAIKSRLAYYVFDPVTDYLQANLGMDVETMRITLSEQALQFLTADGFDALPQQMTIKHQGVFFASQVTQNGLELVLHLDDVRIEKLSRSADFKDASGIVVDLPDVSFADVAGHEKIKMRLLEVLNLVRHSEELTALGEQTPKGMLLYGVPGTGKTLLAKAFACEAQLPFLACSGNDLLSEGFIRKLFTRAREYSPALIFIDEIDAVPKRGTAGPHADALVNRLLVEIDGFNTGNDGLFIIAATNRKKNIDSAILRSGRIDLHFEVPQLDKGARRWFIEQMLKKPIFDNSINVEVLVTLTAGLSGADLQKISRESILYALRESLESISETVLINQVNTLKYGHELLLEDNELRMQETAYHEAGHAVVSKLLLPERKIEQVTVVARSNFLGMVSYDTEQQHDYHRDFLFGLTCVALAGRIAQRKQFGSRGVDAGAAGDLEQAMNYAWLAIAKWGMDSTLENINVAKLQALSEQAYFQREIEARIQAWMTDATKKTQILVNQNWQALEQVALAVLEREVLDEVELLDIMKKNQNSVVA